MKTETKTKQDPKLKKYTVKIDVLVPVTLSFNLEAEDPEKANQKAISDLNSGKSPTQRSSLSWNKIKKLQSKVYRQGTHNLLLTK